MRISDWSSDVCSSDLARQWLSGFGGSAGTLVVTTDFAGLWTDSRYWEQADSDLADTGIRTMRAGAPDVPGPAQWLADHLTKGTRVNIDGQVLAVQAQRPWQTELPEKGISLVIDMDALWDIWAGRPEFPPGKCFDKRPPFSCTRRGD